MATAGVRSACFDTTGSSVGMLPALSDNLIWLQGEEMMRTWIAKVELKWLIKDLWWRGATWIWSGEFLLPWHKQIYEHCDLLILKWKKVNRWTPLKQSSVQSILGREVWAQSPLICYVDCSWSCKLSVPSLKRLHFAKISITFAATYSQNTFYTLLFRKSTTALMQQIDCVALFCCVASITVCFLSIALQTGWAGSSN